MFIHWLDTLLITPFRWSDDPMVGLWLGLLSLVVISTLVGEASRALSKKLNHEVERRAEQELGRYHGLTLRALHEGDRPAYNAVNRLATDALSRTLGLGMTKTLAILWPACLAMAWIHARFHGIVLAEVQTLHLEVGAVGAFALCFVALRLMIAHLRHRQTTEEAL